MVSKHIKVTGKVQGVFFRKNAKQKAKELNVFGWVKNAGHDRVEIFAQGNKADVEKFIEWCSQGPPKAEVKKIDVIEKEIGHSLKDFSIVYED